MITGILDEVVKQAKKSNEQALLYWIYDGNELLYIGIGGASGTRKGWHRLRKHMIDSSQVSSTRWSIMRDRMYRTNCTLKEFDEWWNTLTWKIEYGTPEYILQYERDMIQKYKPRFNKIFNT